MIERGYEHCVHVFHLKEPSEVAMCYQLRPSCCGGERSVRFVHTTNRDRMDIRLFQKRTPDRHAAVAATNDAHLTRSSAPRMRIRLKAVPALIATAFLAKSLRLISFILSSPSSRTQLKLILKNRHRRLCSQLHGI